MRTNNRNRSYGGYESNNRRSDYDDFSYGSNRGYSGGGEISPAAYNGTIGGVLVYGFLVNVLMIAAFSDYFVQMNPILLIVIYFISALAGIFISRASDNPWVSFLGYNLVVVPIGMVLSVCLVGVSSISVMHAVAITGGVTLVMLLLSQIYPRVFLSMGRVLGVILLVVIIAEVICLIIGKYMPTFWDVLVAILFCCYIGYDWARAQEQEFTYDNAIDACVGLYLDIVNLFLRVLSILGRRDD